MVLSSSATVGSVDSGLIINRGNDTNVGFIWDESNDHFAVINTNDDGTTAGHAKYSPSYVPIKSSKVIVGSSEITEAIAGTISGVSAGTVSAGKAIVIDSNKHVDVIKTSQLHLGSSGSAVQVTSSANELNLLDGSSAGTVTNSKAVIYGTSGEINASKLQISGQDITASVADINKLDGLATTAQELGFVSGVSSGMQTQLDDRYTKTAADGEYALQNRCNDYRWSFHNRLNIW